MNTFTRILASGPGAFIITTGLVLVMAKMITVPYASLPDKPEKMSFIINPEITPDPKAIKRKMDTYTKVEIPPAAPRVDTAVNNKVMERPYDFDETIPPFKDLSKEIKLDAVSVDLDLVPIFRAAPAMPPRAQRSGHCDVVFDVNSSGITYNVRIISCSDKLFSRASIKAAGKWKYRAQMIDGKSVSRTGLHTTITFELTDGHGRLIPE